MKQTILSIAGRPGLYKLVSRGNNSLIVETLDETHTRRPAFATDRVTSLSDIAMYTDEEDIPLGTVLASVRDKKREKADRMALRVQIGVRNAILSQLTDTG